MSKWWCFFGVHEWETEQQYQATYWHGGKGFLIIQRCKCCGIVRRRAV